MPQQSLILGNTGFDVQAMAQLTEAEFIALHKDNEDAKYGKTDDEYQSWLKDAYKQIKKAAKPADEEKPEPSKPVNKKADTAKDLEVN